MRHPRSPHTLVLAFLIAPFLAILWTGVTLSLSACAADHARTSVAIPALQRTEPSISGDARHGASTLPPPEIDSALLTVSLFSSALRSPTPDTATAVHAWPIVKDLALASISARETSGAIGPGVASSLRERLVRFESLLLRSSHP